MWYAVAGVLILNGTVSPGSRSSTWRSPGSSGSPAPLTCQSLGGSPGSVFSQAITLVPHGVEVGVGVGSARCRSRSSCWGRSRTRSRRYTWSSRRVGVGVGVGPVPVWNMTSTQ